MCPITNKSKQKKLKFLYYCKIYQTLILVHIIWSEKIMRYIHRVSHSTREARRQQNGGWTYVNGSLNIQKTADQTYAFSFIAANTPQVKTNEGICSFFRLLIAISCAVMLMALMDYYFLVRDVTFIPLCEKPVTIEKIVPLEFIPSRSRSRKARGILPVSLYVNDGVSPSFAVTDKFMISSKNEIKMSFDDSKSYIVTKYRKVEYTFQQGDEICIGNKIEKFRHVRVETIRWKCEFLVKVSFCTLVVFSLFAYLMFV